MIGKDKVMLQIPVNKAIALDIKEICKSTETKTGELFEIMFATFVQICKAKAETKKEEPKNEDRN